MRKALFILLCLVLPRLLNGQTPLFRHFTSEDGLPSSQVYQALEDHEGYLWLATDHGLSRYNGYEFTTYGSENGLTDNTVFKLRLDDKNRVWMQTASGQLFYCQGENVMPHKSNDKVTGIVINNTPNGFLPAGDGIFFGASWIGIHYIGPDGTIRQAGDNTNRSITFITHNGKDYIHSGSPRVPGDRTDINIINEKGATEFFSIDYPASGNAGILKTAGGAMLMNVSGNIFSVNGRNVNRLYSSSTEIISLFEDSRKRIWACTYEGLLLFDNIYKDSVPVHYLGNNFISSACEDREGGLWFTTLNNGVYYLADDKIKSIVFDKQDLSEPTSLAPFGGKVHAGFWNGKIIALTSSGYDMIFNAPDGIPVSRLFADNEVVKLYIASNEAGYLQDGKFHRLKTGSGRGLRGNFIKTKKGKIYNASINHLFEVRDDSLIVVSALASRANCIFETPDGSILLGCNKGAFLLDTSDYSMTLLHKDLRDLRIDDISFINDRLLLATRGKGLYILSGNDLKIVDEASGLSGNIIQRLAVTGNTVWCFSYKGISKVTFNPDFSRYTISMININEGLSSNEVNDAIIMNDTVWVATKNAISFFNVASDFSSHVAPLLKAASFRVNNRDTCVQESYTLRHNANSIAIEMEAISLRNAGNIIYHYSLISEGDTFTTSTAGRLVEFFSLKPGEYRLTFHASNAAGNRSDEKTIKFTILPPFWQQWWFVILLLSGAAVIVSLLLKQHIRNIRKQETLKTSFNKQLVRLEIKALRAQMNPHFIFNVMNSIQDYILKNDTRSAQRYLTKFARLVRLILDNSISEEVRLSDELKAACLYIELEQQRFDDKFDFELINETDEGNTVLIPSMIIQPYLENAIKHGIRHLEGKGKIRVEIREKEEHLFIAIEDNGVGRKVAGEWNKMNEREHISRGSLITANRIRAYNLAHNTTIQTSVTDVTDTDGRGMGTRVELHIPMVRPSSGLMPVSS